MLQSPSAVPALGLEQMVSKKPTVMNDEVAHILKGLQLDRKFFVSRIDASQTKDLVPMSPLPQDEDNSPTNASGASRRVNRMRTKVIQKHNNRAMAKGATDFDLYLGEALLPVLAQALDALCRQINRMQQQGDNLDPKVRARFNPVTFLAQQVLRRHPKAARTPRRQAIYANFRDWSDLERGRREMLRRRELIKEAFDGFVLRGVVQREDLGPVIEGIDEKMRLEGILMNHKEIRGALHLDRGQTPDSPRPFSPSGSMKRRDRSEFFKCGGWTFEQFWHALAGVIMAHDVVPFSAIQRGIELQQQKALLVSEAEEARKREEEEIKQYEAEQKKMSEEYTALHTSIQENEHIVAILTQSKVLTGDDVRPGDAGYEFEVPPNGEHVTLLFKLLLLLGFENAFKKSEEKADAARWWDDELASAWSTLQEIFRAEIRDGVVEEEVLQKVLVAPASFLTLRNKILEELDNLDKDGSAEERRGHRSSVDADGMSPRMPSKKPSIETLCQRLGVTMSRMEWMHRLFESFLTADEKDPGAVPVCLYPEAPGSISKVQMKALMTEVRPDMEEVEFEMRFRRIDQDLSGTVEFDEFVTWVREDEVRVAGAAPMQKMSFEELAVVYGESVTLIKYLHDQFQDRFPEDDRDNYPTKPRSLAKQEVRALIAELTPDMTDADFETHWQMTTFGKKDSLDFDEFLEVLPMDELPHEVTEDDPPSSP